MSFGRLYNRVWNRKGLRLHTKLKAYKAVVLTQGGYNKTVLVIVPSIDQPALRVRNLDLLQAAHQGPR